MIHKSENKDYEKELCKYHEQLLEFKEIEKQYHSEEILKEHRSERIENAIKLTVEPVKHDNPSEYRIGKNEKYFLPFLKKYFGDRIHTGLVYQTGKMRDLVPDFIYMDDESKIVIDIEIDEPYTTTSDGEVIPIHTLDGEHDHQRNQLFIEAGWFIIRFADEQIVRYPDQCAKVIAFHLSNIFGDESILEPFHNVGNLPLIPCWTEKDSLRLIEENYRESYSDAHVVTTDIS